MDRKTEILEKRQEQEKEIEEKFKMRIIIKEKDINLEEAGEE